jgi:hypothetical protein
LPALRAKARAWAHVNALPDGDETRRRATAWLIGDGTVSLVTETAGAEVWAAPYAMRERRLVPGEARRLGVTPLVDVPVRAARSLS